MNCTMLMTMVMAAVATWAAMATAAEPMYPKLTWDVGIRECYLKGLEQPDVWTAARAIGVRRLEVVVDKSLACPHLFEGNESPYKVATPEDRAKLAAALKKHDIEISCFCCVVGGKNGPDMDQVAWITKVAEAAGELKVPVIMMPLGCSAPNDDAYVKNAIAFLSALVPAAKKTGVQLTIENLGHYLNRREIVVPIMKGVPTDQVGLANDITNMYWYGHPVEELYKLAADVAPFVRYVHVKSIKYPDDKKHTQRKPGWEYGKYAEPVRTGDVDFVRVISTYAQAGFKGDLTIEDDSLGKFDAAGKLRVLRDDVKLLREIITKVAK